VFKSARLELTGACDIKCLYCHAGDKNIACNIQNELSHERWLEIVAECRDLGVTDFVLTGGEPFCYKQWAEIVEACGVESRVVISTNGRHFTSRNLEVLSSLPQVKEFRTSLDGLATNDIIREGSSYVASLATIAQLGETFPDKKVMIQTVVYQENLAEIMSLYEKLKELGIYCWRLSQLWKTVRTDRNRHILDFSDYDEMFALYAQIIQQHVSDDKPFLLRIDSVYYSWIDSEDYAPMCLSGHPCAYNMEFLCINANGDVIFCPALNVPFASVKDQSIREAISGSAWLGEFKDMTIGSLGCTGCRYIRICGAGCRADALRWLGKVEKIDPNSCCIMPRVENVILPLLGTEEQAAFKALIDKDGSFPLVTGSCITDAVSCLQKGG